MLEELSAGESSAIRSMPGEARSAIHSPTAPSVQNQLTPPTAVCVDAKMAMREVQPWRFSGLNPRCDIFGRSWDEGTHSIIRGVWSRVSAYRSPLCRLAPYWPRSRRRIPGLSTIGGPSIGMEAGFRRITWRPPNGFAKPRSGDSPKLSIGSHR